MSLPQPRPNGGNITTNHPKHLTPMLTNWKNIAVFLDDTPEAGKLGDYAAGLARQHSAHLIGIYGITHATGEHPQDSFVRGVAAITQALSRHKNVDGERVLAAGRHFRELSRAYDLSAEFRVIWNDRADEDAVSHSLHCDLVIVGHPKPHGIPGSWSPDRWLRTSGVPVLMVPDKKAVEEVGNHVLVAWNASREARRSITDAMPFIVAAKKVTILVIDAGGRTHNYGEEPGADIALHLTRHGARIEVEQVSSEGHPVAEVILAYAAKHGADLIVAGARSHARSTEIIFGGVTQSLLAHLNVPLLMSR